MKKSFVKVLTLLMAVMMLITCFAGCKKEEVAIDELTVWGLDPTRAETEEIGQEVLDYAASKAEFPVKWISGSADALKLRFASGDYPDVVMSNGLSGVDVVKYADSGILLPLDEYINKKDTPNIYALLEEYPSVKGLITLSDGHIYALPRITDFTPSCLESALFINKAWLDKLGLEIPTTMEELYDVLKAFKTQDPNGNGKADEIPMSFLSASGYHYPEVLLSAWGISAKHGTWDQFLAVKDGKVLFAPVTEEWKKMIKYYNKLYEEGLLDMECITHDGSAFGTKVASAESKVGFFWSNANMAGRPEEYIAIPPLGAEGNKPVWHIHPQGFTKANANLFEMTVACENPQAVMRWIDQFYGEELAIQMTYGLVGNTLTLEDGKYTINEPPAGKSQSLMLAKAIPGSAMGLFKSEWIDTKVEKTIAQGDQEKLFAIYEDYVDDEIWPRPYYETEDSATISRVTADLFRLVEEKKGKWIVGQADIDKEWDKYKKDLKNLGLDELVSISQKAYDVYLKNAK